MKKFRLPKEFGQKWIEALRSGEYRQGTGALVTITGDAHIDHYCCLGVACKVAGIDTGDFMEYNTIPTDIKGFSEVPDEIKGQAYESWAQKNEFVDHLVTMNDDDEKNFHQIAEWIEENVNFY